MSSQTEQRVDVVIVGAGVIGLACAWQAARTGLRIRVLEREAPGSGASGVAAGMLAPVGEATWGEEALLGLALASHRAWPRFAAELGEATGGEVGLVSMGALHVAFDRDEADELRRRYELMRDVDLEATWLRPRQARELEPGLSPRCAAAVHAPHEAAIDPRMLVNALRDAAQRQGVEVLAGAEASELLVDGNEAAGVRTADGREHRAERVVAASGAWSGPGGWLPEPLAPPVRPVKGEILTLRGAPLPAERIVVSERVYLVPRADGRVVVGATVEERGFETTVSAGGVLELLREAYRALPDIGELELVETVAGLRPGTPDNAPLVGWGDIPGLLLATGHYRNGILLAPVTARAVAALLGDEELQPELQVADPARLTEVMAS